MDVTKDVKDPAVLDAAWQRAWDQLHTAIERRVRVGLGLDPFALLELMEEVHDQMREELAKEAKAAAASRRRPARDDDYGAAVGEL